MMFFWRLATEKLFCSAYHVGGEPGCLDHTPSWMLLVAMCSNCRQSVSRVGLSNEACKGKILSLSVYPTSFCNIPASASLSVMLLPWRHSWTCSDLMWDKVGSLRSQFGSPAEPPYSRGMRKHLEGNHEVTMFICTFPTVHSLFCFGVYLRMGIMSHSLPSL